MYVTEFGVQTKPNPYVGVSFAQQAEFDAIAEHIAWNNPRVVSFSQYLLRDDHPAGGRVVGSQSGLETYRGVAKPALNGFRLPLTVTRTSGGVAFWGIVRPVQASGKPVATAPTGPTAATGPSGSTGASGSGGSTATSDTAQSATTVVIQYSANRGRSWHPLKTVRIGSGGAWSANGIYAGLRLWRVKWTSPSAVSYYGAPIRAYTPTGKVEFTGRLSGSGPEPTAALRRGWLLAQG